MTQNYIDRRSAYVSKLKDPRWQRVRLEVLQRDSWRCGTCHSTDKTLNVHHRYYLDGAAPWEYPLDSLVTLCEDCHSVETAALRDEQQHFLLSAKRYGFTSQEFGLLADAFEGAEPPDQAGMAGMLLAVYDAIHSPEFRGIVREAHREYIETLQRRAGRSTVKDFEAQKRAAREQEKPE